MAKNSAIEWTHHTFNPWWGCTRVSPGCVHCYAETFDRRVSGVEGAHWGVQADRRFFGEKHWNEPLRWDREAAEAGERRRVFCASMADVFEDREDLVAHRARLFLLIEATPHLDWLLLTKRPENMVRLAGWRWGAAWPSNVWAGCTVEDQRRAEERIPNLLRVPAVVRFLSCEPLLEGLDIRQWLGGWRVVREHGAYGAVTGRRAEGIDWVIIGGESGAGARPFHPEWASDLLDQCRAAHVRPFVKQLGARPVGLVLADAKGGDWSEWPENLRVREFPAAPAVVS